jgi:hypothetical protein
MSRVYQDDDETPVPNDRFADALDLCRLAWDTQKTAKSLKKLRKLEKDIAAANTKLAAAEARTAEIIAKAESDVAAIHDEAQRRLEAAEAGEQELRERERRVQILEAAWRNLGEPADVMSGFRAPEHTPLQKAKLAHGQQPGRDPDVHLFTQDAEPVVAIDALIRRDVGDERSDAQGNAFAPSTLHRDVSHKRRVTP